MKKPAKAGKSHDKKTPASSRTVIVDRSQLNPLITFLAADGYQVIGPKLSEGAITYDELESADELPVGWIDQQEGGTYRLTAGGRGALFDYVVGPHSLKRYFHPPVQRLWRAQRQGKGMWVDEQVETPSRYAFFGVRSCDIHAMLTQDRVFMGGPFTDPGYMARRAGTVIVAVNCARPAATCFCASLQTGPRPTQGFDLALTELLEGERHEFFVEVGTAKGAELLGQLTYRDATPADVEAVEALTARAAKSMKRELVPNVASLLKRNLDHPRWDDVAHRCLNCTNCTLVCPTCFCTTVEDVTDLTGDTAERWRKWDSCFTIDFSYIHGGSMRREGRSRYRQWINHKLSTWHDQFGTSGCVGCGRCITWCPVGIDITEETRIIRDSGGEK